MGKRRVTLRNVAERANVSVSTVSLVLNDKALDGNVRISDQTIRMVRRAALEMGYLLRGTVGLIVPWIWPAVEVPLIKGITEVFREAHYSLAMGVTTGRHLDVELEEIRAMDTKGFDSIIIQPGFELMAQPELLRRNFRNWKHVVVANLLPCPGFTYVTVDPVQCGYIATKHLLDLGHRRVVCARGNIPGKDPILAARTEGYVKAMADYGLQPLVLRGKEETLAFAEDVTAVFCCRYRAAADFAGACIDRKIRVPDDLSIVGIADDREKVLVRPKLTTVDLRAYEMGRMIAQMVLDAVDGQQPESMVLQPDLVVRDSTRAL